MLYITAFASVFAYFWLYLIVDVISPNKIEVWEAAITCAMFPLLLLVAWCADKGTNPSTQGFSQYTHAFTANSHIHLQRCHYYTLPTGHCFVFVSLLATDHYSNRSFCISIFAQAISMVTSAIMQRPRLWVRRWSATTRLP